MSTEGEPEGVRYDDMEELGAYAYAPDKFVPDGYEAIKISVEDPSRLEWAKKVASHFKDQGVEYKELSKPGQALVVVPYNESLEPSENLKRLKEGFEKVDLEMEDKIIHVSEEEKPVTDDEMIVPVSTELSNELLDADPMTAEVPVEDEAPLDLDTPIEEPSFEDDDEEPIEDDDEEIDYDIDEFNEDEFDKLGESYLKEVYENVQSFKTSSVHLHENSLIIEGKIKFNSGAEKTTHFIFEAKDATNNGKVRFIGENANITRGKKAFTLTGRVNGSKFIAESFNYNYRAKDAEGKSNRVYGTIKL